MQKYGIWSRTYSFCEARGIAVIAGCGHGLSRELLADFKRSVHVLRSSLCVDVKTRQTFSRSERESMTTT